MKNTTDPGMVVAAYYASRRGPQTEEQIAETFRVAREIYAAHGALACSCCNVALDADSLSDECAELVRTPSVSPGAFRPTPRRQHSLASSRSLLDHRVRSARPVHSFSSAFALPEPFTRADQDAATRSVGPLRPFDTQIDHSCARTLGGFQCAPKLAHDGTGLIGQARA
jgi:hypothetical protein